MELDVEGMYCGMYTVKHAGQAQKRGLSCGRYVAC